MMSNEREQIESQGQSYFLSTPPPPLLAACATIAAPGHCARPTLPQTGGAEEHLGGVPLLPSFL
jgi:hypothetical protein